MARTYQTKTKDRKTVELEVDGRVLVWKQPKNAKIVLPLLSPDGNADQAAAKALFDYIGSGLSDDDEKWLESRLKDEDDDFDVEDMNGIAEEFMAEVGQTPPTSQPDSGTPPETTG